MKHEQKKSSCSKETYTRTAFSATIEESPNLSKFISSIDHIDESVVPFKCEYSATDISYTFHGIERGCLTLSSVITPHSLLDATGKNNSKKHGNETSLFVQLGFFAVINKNPNAMEVLHNLGSTCMRYLMFSF